MRCSTGGSSDQLQTQQCECIMAALEATPWVGVFVLSGGGCIEYTTRAASEILFRCEPRSAVGRTLTSMLPERFGHGLWERMSRHDVYGERVILGGWQVVITCSGEIEGGDGGRGCTVQRVAGVLPERWQGLDIHFADCADFGRLNPLTAKELEIAAYLGAGLGVREIASLTHRSTKTIENHRISIGRKLKVSSRTEIAILAHHAGLRPADSTLRRLPSWQSAADPFRA